MRRACYRERALGKH